ETPRVVGDTISLRRPGSSARRRWPLLGAVIGTALLVVLGLGYWTRPLWSSLLNRTDEKKAEQSEIIDNDHFQAKQYYSAFAREPRPLLWVNTGNSEVHWNPHGDALSATYAQRTQGLLSCGDMEADFFELGTQIYQTSWSGEAGIFFGFQGERKDGEWVKCEYQAITSYPVYQRSADSKAEKPKAKYQLVRTWHARNNGVAVQDHLADAPIAEPANHEYTLLIRCAKGRVMEVRWDGMSFPELANPARPIPPTK